MKGSINLLLSDNLIKISLAVSLIILFLQAILTLFFFQKLPPLIPLMNSYPWGVERLFPSYSILLVLLLLTLFYIGNNLLSIFFYKTNSLVARILSFNALLFIILGFLAYIQILLLVF